MEKDKDVWLLARDLFRRMEELTEILGESIERGEMEKLAPLLEERQKLCDQLDRLKAERGFDSWVVEPLGSSPAPSGEGPAREEIKGILERLVKKDEVVRQSLHKKMSVLKKDMAELRQIKNACRSYQGTGALLDGAFIDSRR